MATILIEHDLSKDLTMVKARGEMTASDFYTLAAHCVSKGATGLILWDLLGANICELSSDEILMIATRTKKIVPKDGKTAFVVGTPCDFGVGRMLEAHSDVAQITPEFRAFRKMDDAKKWLGV